MNDSNTNPTNPKIIQKHNSKNYERSKQWEVCLKWKRELEQFEMH